jgi:rhodanese-related sulfurtransferase
MTDSRRIELEDVKRRMDAGEKIVFVDSRNPMDWGAAEQKLPGAVRVGVGEAEEKVTKIPEGALIVAYCT